MLLCAASLPLAVPLAGFAGIADFEQSALPVAGLRLAVSAGAVTPDDKVENSGRSRMTRTVPWVRNGVMRAPGRLAVLALYAGRTHASQGSPHRDSH
jgi:hypothetical protein